MMVRKQLIKLTRDEYKALRKTQWVKQECCCPILRQRLPYEKAVFDHKHKTKAEVLGEDGKGLLRGVIHSQANVMEGKIANMYKRYGLHKFLPLPELLRNLADYLENPPMRPEYIHPNENPSKKKLGKRDYNRIKKYYFQIFPKKKKVPPYPARGKTNPMFEDLLEKANELHGDKND